MWVASIPLRQKRQMCGEIQLLRQKRQTYLRQKRQLRQKRHPLRQKRHSFWGEQRLLRQKRQILRQKRHGCWGGYGLVAVRCLAPGILRDTLRGQRVHR